MVDCDAAHAILGDAPRGKVMDFELIKRKVPASFLMSDEQLKQRAELDKAAVTARQYAEEAMMMLVGTMRSTQDEKVRVKCAVAIIERAYGPARAADGSSNEDADSIVEVLARISTTAQQPALGNPVYDAIGVPNEPG